MRWIAIVPVKGGPLAKSRLRDLAEHGFPAREELAQAFAVDTVGALLASASIAEVVVVTSDGDAATELAGVGATIVPESMRDAGPAELDDPLNRAIALGIAAAEALDRTAGLLVVTGDLPSVRPGAVDELLRRASRHPLSMVTDTEGTGTTMLLAAPALGERPAASLRPRFGHGSREKHERAGHHVLDAPPALRRDIDTADELREAIALGIGPRTTAVLDGSRETDSSSEKAAPARRRNRGEPAD